MAEEENGKDGSGGESNDLPATIEVEVDGKKHTIDANRAADLIKQQAAATQRSQQVKPLLDFAEQYNADPKTLVEQATGAFNVLGNLIDAGIIDEEGNPIQKDSDEGGKRKMRLGQGSDDNSGEDGTSLAVEEVLSASAKRTEEIVSKALGTVGDKVERLEKDNARLVRTIVDMRLEKQFPDLSEEDRSQLMAIAAADKDSGKDLTQHAKELVEKKGQREVEAERRFAEKYGLNLDDIKKANELKEQSSKGASAFVPKEKGFSWSRRNRGKSKEDTASPLEATKQFLRGQGFFDGR